MIDVTTVVINERLTVTGMCLNTCREELVLKLKEEIALCSAEAERSTEQVCDTLEPLHDFFSFVTVLIAGGRNWW